MKQRFFNYGQVYVAISRSITLQGIYILGQIEHRHVRKNPKVYEEYRRLRSTSTLEPPVQTAFDRQMSITILNVRSLKKHSLDIKFHFSIFNSDLIALTETQLLPQTNDNDIQDHLVHQSRITLLLLYRKHNSSIVQYVEHLRYIINSHDIHIILGDFNINYFNDDEVKPLNDMMNSSNYTQVVQSPTFISSRSLLDHIYVKSLYLHKIIHSVIPVYYSDHDAIKIIIEN